MPAEVGRVMGFVGAALGFPAVVFSFALLVVIAYWVLVMLGGLGIDALDGDGGDSDSADADVGLLHSLGFSGVPVTVVLSLLIAVAWFVSLAGTVLLDRFDVPGRCQLADPIAPDFFGQIDLDRSTPEVRRSARAAAGGRDAQAPDASELDELRLAHVPFASGREDGRRGMGSDCGRTAAAPPGPAGRAASAVEPAGESRPGSL